MLDTWKSVLSEIEQMIPSEQFSTWFTGAELLSTEGGTVVIGVPNVFKRTQLQAKYSDIIKEAFAHSHISVNS